MIHQEKKTPGSAIKKYLNSIKQDILDGFANFGDAIDLTSDWFTVAEVQTER